MSPNHHQFLQCYKNDQSHKLNSNLVVDFPVRGLISTSVRVSSNNCMHLLSEIILSWEMRVCSKSSVLCLFDLDMLKNVLP